MGQRTQHRMRRTTLGAGAFIAVAASLLAISAAAVAHIAYDSSGRFMHQSHSRDLNFYNGVDHSNWRAQTRDAQLDWHNKANGSLRFYSTSHASSVIHAHDGNYGDTGWVGFAWNWGYHNGHGHARLNLYYAGSLTDHDMQQTSCHEVGHFTGLRHTLDATDCMHDGVNSNYGQGIDPAHISQLRDAWNAWGH